jgi:uncharacterized damage-inducible protein DinB
MNGDRFLTDIRKQFTYYKTLGDKALEQVSDDEFYFRESEEFNSIAIIVKHICGNLLSRFTQFRTTDGEKPWRHRDTEFILESTVRADMMQIWEKAWAVLFTELESLTATDMDNTITVRTQPHNISTALIRSLAHISHHIGQIVLLAKAFRKEYWNSLSIPKNQSESFNVKATNSSKPDHYTDHLLSK